MKHFYCYGKKKKVEKMRLRFFKEEKEQQTITSEKKRHLYLVDFENTKKDGLYGLESLDDTSEVIVFFGSQDKSIPIDCHNIIMNANAIVSEIQMEKTNKNYLDFQLATYCGYLIGTNKYSEITIISKDAGFDSIVDFWSKKQISIRRSASIMPLKTTKIKETETVPVDKETTKVSNKTDVANKDAKPVAKQSAQKQESKKTTSKNVTESYRKKVRKAVAKLNLTGQHYSVIYRAMAKSSDVNSYKQRICSAAIPESKQVYDVTVGIFEDYVKETK